MSKTLNDYLTGAGIKVASTAPVQKVAAKVTAPTKAVPAAASVPPSNAGPANPHPGEMAGGSKTRGEELNGTKGASFDPATATNEQKWCHERGITIADPKVANYFFPSIRAAFAPADVCKAAGLNPETATQEQIWLAQRGVPVADPKTAALLYSREVKIAENQKTAEMYKNAEEMRNQGALLYHGLMRESAAMQYANGEINGLDVMKVASMIGIDPNSIVKRAEAIAAQMPRPALVGDQLGLAARPDSSATQAAAEHNGATTLYQPDAVRGTRAPTTGMDPALTRFQDAMTLPGNPGLNYGMTVDQGKGPGGK